MKKTPQNPRPPDNKPLERIAAQNERKILSIDEAAQMLKITRTTFYKFVKEKVLKIYGRGNVKYVFYDELIEAAENNLQPKA